MQNIYIPCIIVCRKYIALWRFFSVRTPFMGPDAILIRWRSFRYSSWFKFYIWGCLSRKDNRIIEPCILDIQNMFVGIYLDHWEGGGMGERGYIWAWDMQCMQYIPKFLFCSKWCNIALCVGFIFFCKFKMCKSSNWVKFPNSSFTLISSFYKT